MIEIYKTLPNPEKLQAWLEKIVRPALRPDVSNYAKGRLRAWLGQEPMLFAPFDTKPGVPVDQKLLDRLAELIEWPFDFCLVTYSGDTTPVGIAPHMDAGYADFEAHSVHVSGQCRFDYWMNRPTLGRGPATGDFHLDRTDYTVRRSEPDGRPVMPTTVALLQPGDVIRFNCKNPHAALPDVKRWNLNFWRRKPK
jgi:hypothetical protein